MYLMKGEKKSNKKKLFVLFLERTLIIRVMSAMYLGLMSTQSYVEVRTLHKYFTLPTAEILSGKNARAFLVCGFLMKSFKKNILKI